MRAVVAAAALPAAALATVCKSNVDCSLNGVCQPDGNCLCSPPWSGGVCGVLQLLPVSFPQGYGMVPNETTWGGNVIEDGGKYHLYAAAMTNHCPLQDWGKNSRVDHAVADTPTGPFKFQDVAINTWSHNPAPVRLKDGSYAIFHIGSGSGSATGGKNCSSAASAEEVQSGSTIHVSKSLDGPWTPLPNSLGGCNNPAPWVHPNGTIFIVCGGSILRADSPAGPYTKAASVSHSGGVPGAYEDPFLYTDALGWHVLYHVYDTSEDPTQCVTSTVSAHIFSEDGHTWHSGTEQPYTTQVTKTSGEVITVATRERPKLMFDSSGKMTHLINGVCSATACPGEAPCVNCKYKHWDYTLVHPTNMTQAAPVPFPQRPAVGCDAAAAGYTCYSGKCSGDGAAEANCGADVAEPSTGCDGKNWTCAVAAAAAACNATSGCQSFGLSAAWGLGKAKLFSAGKGGLVSNGDWNVWAK